MGFSIANFGSAIMPATTTTTCKTDIPVEQLSVLAQTRIESGMQHSAQETWIIYLHAATACLDNPSNMFLKEEDHIEHEASKKGSREHIKRIWIMLNKVVGSDQAIAILEKAKKWAHHQQQEQDVERPATILPNPNESSLTGQNNYVLENIPDWLESNEALAHTILLTDP
eukprot:scaffold77056_cov71-Attheya_sp.AAC.4